MKRLLRVICFSFLLVGLGPLPVGALNVNNFSINTYDIKFELGRDDEGRSTLRTTERIIAEFPNFDQNRGIERAIPKEYDGHSTSLKIESVKKTDGSEWNYTTYDDQQGNTVLRIGDADVFVRGTQTYVITYTQRDVTRYYADTNAQEFYWDTNGTLWRVPIDDLSVALEISPELAQFQNGNTACYQGIQGATQQCALIGSDGIYRTKADNLFVGENVTIAVGFTPETFAEYQPTLLETLTKYWLIMQAVLVPLAAIVIAWVSYRYTRTIQRSAELEPISPEYIPPKDVSVTMAARIAKTTKGSALAAQLVDLAVRKYLVIHEESKKQLIGSRAAYHVRIIKPVEGLFSEEKEILSDIFGHLPAPGESLDLTTLRNNSGFARRLADNETKVRSFVRGSYALRAKDGELIVWLRRTARVVALVALLTLSPVLLVAAGVVVVLSFSAWSLTDEGLALRRYLEGLKMYIEVAEKDRLKMLQSPEGAEKAAVLGGDAGDVTQRVVLYERVLPYAILFGQEKEWSKQLGVYYEQVGQKPAWYNSSSAFNAASFSTSMQTLAAATSTYGTSTSSSSGGSSGGGSSGGGGGGGGGGGW